MGGGGDGVGVWDGNVVKLGCDDSCKTIKVIKFIEIKKKENLETEEVLSLEA